MTAPVPAASVRLVRPQDMLVIDFEFHNLRLDPGADPPQLRRIDPALPRVVVVRFESQHITEQTVYENEPDRPAPGAIAARAVGPSRIAFVVPETVKTIPYTETGLLRWWQWVMRVVPGAGRPDGHETDLLVVDWLHLTPEQYATWDHAETPVEHDGRTELWHTRLAARGPRGRPDPLSVPTVRVVAADEPANPEEARLFGALNPEGFDYRQLVTLTNPPEPDAAPVDAALLALSATGATLDLDGRWEPTTTPGLNLKHWEHHAWQGRDNKVILEQYGFLVPYGHRALLFTETKRTFDATTGVAYLEQRRFVRITEPVKEYPGAYGVPFGGRSLPFNRIVVEGPVPPVLPLSPEPLLPGRPEHGFWIQSLDTGADVAFVLRGTDQAGREQRFTAPLGFVPHDVAVRYPAAGTVLRELIDAYGGFDRITGDAPDPRRSVDLAGQELGYTAERDPGTATHPTQRILWGLQGPPGPVDPRPDSPLFFPRMLAAEARLSAVDAFFGPGDPVVLGYDERYLENAFAGNPGEVYVRVRDSVASLGSGEDKPVERLVLNSSGIGGIWAPNFDVGGLSRAIGAVGGKVESIDHLRDEGEIAGKAYFNVRDQANQAVLFGATLLANVLPDNAGGPGVRPEDQEGDPLPEEAQYRDPQYGQAAFGSPDDHRVHHPAGRLRTVPGPRRQQPGQARSEDPQRGQLRRGHQHQHHLRQDLALRVEAADGDPGAPVHRGGLQGLHVQLRPRRRAVLQTGRRRGPLLRPPRLRRHPGGLHLRRLQGRQHPRPQTEDLSGDHVHRGTGRRHLRS
ncbi:hypothetical protein [Streptomyces albipurpureus]|uniref:Uncharacterized protein n=1 Tax=Streptomyces albipurpureus TaxID=2897419 RepID=A0ABT0UFZ6_9ACTN|nr:hypothetical protein [Streptomyces sp. CWNU-1]MCM2387547.1 hypothetical protein [Streptomyces sp. CWNU-1]